MNSNVNTNTIYIKEENIFLSRDLASNHITSIEGKSFKGMSQMHDLLLSHNNIQYIPQDAFFGLSKLQVL